MVEAVLDGDIVTPQSRLPVPPPRYTELDSLRGVAALCVVFYHFRLMWLGKEPLHGWHRALDLIATPFTTGHQAVLLFFVLSGFVLSVPYLRRKGQPYPTFLVRRILRIYAPFLFALLLALAGASVWHAPHGHGPWADETWFGPFNPRLLIAHILFIGNYDWAAYNTAFWSLVMEMRVSLIFPALFALVLWMSSGGALLAAICLCSLGPLLTQAHPSWALSVATFPAIGIFILGILLSKNIDTLSLWMRKLGPGGRLALGLLCLVVYTGGRHIDHFIPNTFGTETTLETFAAAGFLLLAINATAVRDALNARVPRFLGRISYSLYLVHGTVLFALTFALGNRLGPTAQFPLYLVLSLLLATAFCFGIEEPFMRLSRRAGPWAVLRTLSGGN